MNRFVSIIIPTYKAEKCIKKNLNLLINTLSTIDNHVISGYEIIVVIDGSPDHSEEEARKVEDVQIISYKKNMGKGYALKRGFSESKGDIIIFLDADGDIPATQIEHLLRFSNNKDFIIGSKIHPFSYINYPIKRKLLSVAYRIISKIVLKIPYIDTQSGLKIIKRDILEMISQLSHIDGFAFDLELCFLAHTYGYTITEMPILINYRGTSTIKFNTMTKMLCDIFKIQYNFSIKKIYQKKLRDIYF